MSFIKIEYLYLEYDKKNQRNCYKIIDSDFEKKFSLPAITSEMLFIEEILTQITLFYRQQMLNVAPNIALAITFLSKCKDIPIREILNYIENSENKILLYYLIDLEKYLILL